MTALGKAHESAVFDKLYEFIFLFGENRRILLGLTKKNGNGNPAVSVFVKIECRNLYCLVYPSVRGSCCLRARSDPSRGYS